MKAIIRCLLAAGVVLLAGCSSTPTQVNSGAVRAGTFSFVTGRPAPPDYAEKRAEIHTLIQNAITANLDAKGFTRVKNSGNVHFRINSVSLKGTDSQGAETFTSKVDGWYLLADAVRSYSVPVTEGKCAGTAQIEIVVTTDANITLKRQLNVEKAQCLP